MSQTFRFLCRAFACFLTKTSAFLAINAAAPTQIGSLWTNIKPLAKSSSLSVTAAVAPTVSSTVETTSAE